MTSANRLLLKNTPEDVIVLNNSDIATWQRLISAITPSDNYPPYTIWLTQIEQIHQFVYHVPALAWELMDYATEPLSIIYSQAKPFYKREAPPEVCIRLINEQPLQKVLSRRHAWLAVPAENLPTDFSASERVEKETDLRNTMKAFRPVRLMKVYDDGGFAFLN